MWKILNLQHVMIPVVKCVNKIRAKGLNRRKFKGYCKLLDEEYGDLIPLKLIVHDFLEKDELPEKRALFCKENCLLDLAFLIDVV